MPLSLFQSTAIMNRNNRNIPDVTTTTRTISFSNSTSTNNTQSIKLDNLTQFIEIEPGNENSTLKLLLPSSSYTFNISLVLIKSIDAGINISVIFENINSNTTVDTPATTIAKTSLSSSSMIKEIQCISMDGNIRILEMMTKQLN